MTRCQSDSSQSGPNSATYRPMATDSAERIYERILARVGAEELRVHCNKLLREKVQLATHKTLQDALRAWRRLQEVQQAGEQLQEKQSETSQTRSFTSDAVSSLVDTIRETQQLQRRLAASVRQLGVIPQLQEVWWSVGAIPSWRCIESLYVFFRRLLL